MELQKAWARLTPYFLSMAIVRSIATVVFVITEDWSSMRFGLVVVPVYIAAAAIGYVYSDTL